MREPKPQADLSLLWTPFQKRVEELLKAMRLRGYDPVPFETYRSEQRQKWLWGVGRTHSMKRTPVTWTMDSRHRVGKACDIISKSRGWNYPAFYDALREEALKLNLRDYAGQMTFKRDCCHVQWGGK